MPRSDSFRRILSQFSFPTLRYKLALGASVLFLAGYSCLAQLKRLPVDEVKIDRSFISNLDQDSDGQVIVRSTIDLAHNLGLEVVAEGVETQSEWDLLVGWSCDVAQGYLISKPIPEADMTAQLAAALEIRPVAPAAAV